MPARFTPKPTADPTASPSSQPTATIGIGQGVALYVCAILGAGVLVLPGQAATVGGPASLLAWLFSVLVGLPLAFTFAALASAHPDAGGVATFAARAFGSAAGGVAGWWYFVAGSVGQTIVPLTAGYYVAAALGLDQRWAPALAAAVLAIAVAANTAGRQVGARVQIALAVGVAVVLVVVIVIAVPHVQADRFRPFAPHGLSGVGQAVVALFFAFAGWEAIAHLSGEFRDVRRTLPRATMLTLVVVTVLYVGVATAVIGTGAYGSPERDRISLGVVVGDGLGLSAGDVVAVAAVVICLGTTNAFVASVSRLGSALGRDGWAPAGLSRPNRHGVPARAVGAVGAIGAAGLAGAGAFGWGTDDLVFVPSVLVLATYLLGSASGIRLFTGRRRWVAATALVLLTVTVPFAGWHLAVPVVVAGAVVVGRTVRDHRRPHRRTRVGTDAEHVAR